MRPVGSRLIARVGRDVDVAWFPSAGAGISVSSQHSNALAGFTTLWSNAAFTAPRVVTQFIYSGGSWGGSGSVTIQLAIGEVGAEVVVGEMSTAAGVLDVTPVPLLIPANTRLSMRIIDVEFFSSFSVTGMRIQHASPHAFPGRCATGWLTVRNADYISQITVVPGGTASWVSLWAAGQFSVPVGVVAISGSIAPSIRLEFAVTTTGAPVLDPNSGVYFGPGAYSAMNRFGRAVLVPAGAALSIRNTEAAFPVGSNIGILRAVFAVPTPLPQLAF